MANPPRRGRGTRPPGVYLRDVRRLREEKGVARDRLAHDADVSSRTIAKIEKGEEPVQKLTANRVFNALEKLYGEDIERKRIIYLIKADGEEIAPDWE